MKDFIPIFTHEFYNCKYLTIVAINKLFSKNLVVEKEEFYFPQSYAKLCSETIEILSKIVSNIHELIEIFPKNDISLKFIAEKYEEYFGYHFHWNYRTKKLLTNEYYESANTYIYETQSNILKLFTIEKLREIAIAGYGATHEAIINIEKTKMSLSGFVITLETESEPLLRIHWESKNDVNIHNEFGQFNLIPAIKKMKELRLIEL